MGSAPGCSTASTSARRRAKADDRIEGAIQAGIIGRTCLLCHRKEAAGVRAPVQTVHADFRHKAYQLSVGTPHYAASCQKCCAG